MRPPPQGQVVINLKTTITAHGTHSGVIVHSGIQASPYSNGSSEGSLWSLGHHSSRVPQIETPGGTRIAAAASPLPLTIGPSTSQEHLNTSWNRPFASPQPPTRSESFDHFNGFREIERRPEPPLRSPQSTFLPQRSGSYDHLDRRIQPRLRPPTPPSPVYDFTGRNTPPDEFIEPSKITLNVFDPGRRTSTSYDVGLRRSQPSTADALINDTVTTTTTVEVFRAPVDQGKKFVALPPPPAPGLDDRPQLLRLDGPAYEKWSNTRSETLINDRPVVNKAVQWREKLVEKEISNEYDGQRLVDSRSPFANAVLPPRPPSSTHQYYTPTVHHIDERLVPPMVSRSTSPYMVQSPSEFSMTSHPMITSSNEEERNQRYLADSRGNSAMGYHQPIRTFESPSNMAQLRVQPYGSSSGMNGNTPILTSPVYVEPRRQHEERPRDTEIDRYGYSTVDRRPRDSGRRSKSVHRKKTREEELRARSVSPLSRRPSWADDPNRLPNMPRRSNSRDVFHLYETRDAFDNVVSQFSELEMCELAGGLLLSPLAESEESLISETSARNDRAKADYLETREIPNFDIYKIAEKFYQSRNPLMISKSADHIYAKPRYKEIEEEIYDDEEEHIYEDIDSVRESISMSNLAKVYHTVAEDYGEYEEIPPPLPPRRKRPEHETSTSDDQQKTIAEETADEHKKNERIERPTDLGMSSSEEERILQGTSSDSGSTLSTTTADSSDSGAPSFAEVVFVEEEWPPPPHLFRKPRRAHPDGHVFPRITSSVQLMPRLPEDKEYSSEKEDSGGIPLSPLYLEIFEKEPKPASPIGRTQISPVPVIPEVKVIDEKSTGTVFVEEEDLPFADASPRILSPS